jgi:hypothetical protein
VDYELRELTGYSMVTDNFASATHWSAATPGFALSTARAYSAPNSYFGGTGNNRNATSTLNQPIAVTPGMQISLRTWYNIESNWDYGYVEVSTNGSTWTPIAGSITTTSNPNGTNDGNGITGTSGGAWVLATFPLSAYVGQSIQVRLRYETDGGVLNEGFYVDDFSPVVSFATEEVVDAAITATSHSFTTHEEGTFVYKVRARDGEDDRSGWSNLVQVTVTGGEDLTGPAISHTELPDTSDDLGPWLVQAQVTDGGGVAAAQLEYRVNDGGWNILAMDNPEGSLWEQGIPGPLGTPSLVEYRVRATDASPAANESVSPVYDFQILAPAGLAYCQDFETGLADFTVVEHEPAGNGWTASTFTGQGGTAYIQYGSTTQEDHASLLSPVFDCGDQATVELSFWHHLRMGYSGAWTEARVKGSIDGGATWPYLLGEWTADGTGGEVTVEGGNSLDISAWAAGQPQVRIAFEYADLYDWYWHVDDVCLAGTLMAPAPTTLSIAMSGGSAQLSWLDSGAAAYHVYGGTEPQGPFTFLARVTGTGWTDVGAQAAGRRCYEVRSWMGSAGAADPASIPRLDPQAGRMAASPLTKP